MGAHKDRLIQAAELLDMSPDDLTTLLESTYRYPFAESLVGIARQRQARILAGGRVDPEDARTLARAFRELDIHLSAGGTPPEEWREGPDAPRVSNAPAEDGPHAFEPRDPDEARRYGLSVAGCDYCGQVAADPIHEDDVTARLEYLRGELRGERISYGELAELQDLATHIDPGDVELLEAAGVPEFPEDDEPDREPTPAQEEAWDVREDEARGHVLG